MQDVTDFIRMKPCLQLFGWE